MTLINMGVFMFYYQYDGMRSLTGAPFITKISIANMGFSEPVCSNVNYGVDHNLITCPYGTIQKIHSFGIHPKQLAKNATSSGTEMEDVAVLIF